MGVAVLRPGLVALALWMALAGPMAAQEAAPDGVIDLATDAASDARIRDRITDILTGLDGFDGVRVAVDSGIVTLTGEVLDRAAVARLDRLAGRVEGVVEVQNSVTETTDLSERLNPVLSRFKARVEQTIAWLPLLAVAAVAALVIGLTGGWIARRRQPWDRIAPNPFIAEILRQVVRLAFWLGAIVVALDILGASALLGTFLGAAGIMGIALGFAVRDTVENFIASVMLSLRQPFRPNDLIELEGHLGRVIRLTSRATTLLSLDGNHIRIPNATVFKAQIVNYTRNPERRFSFDLGVDAGADLHKVRELGLATLKGLPFTLDQPAPAVWVQEVGDSNVLLRFSAWLTQQGADFNIARGEAIRILKETIEGAGYGLPEPIYRVKLEDITAEMAGAGRDGAPSATEGGTEAAGSEALARHSRTKAHAPAPQPLPQALPEPLQPPVDVAPDTAIEKMADADRRKSGPDASEPNLLSANAPQE